MEIGDQQFVRGSVTQWISAVRLGNEEAASKLWDRFGGRLKALARKTIKSSHLAVADEDDLANDALGAFLESIQKGDFSQLDDREGLWKLLARITINRARTLIRNEKRGKRDFRRTIGENDLNEGVETKCQSRELAPDAELLFAELMNQFLNILDGDLPSIALARMEGKSNREIADLQGVSLPTIERRLRLIRLSLLDVLDE